jgi:hypothetical protein
VSRQALKEACTTLACIAKELEAAHWARTEALARMKEAVASGSVAEAEKAGDALGPVVAAYYAKEMELAAALEACRHAWEHRKDGES